MRRSLAKFSESEASNHTPSSADFTTTTPELKFSVHTGVEAYPDSFWAERIAVAAVALTGARAEARRMGRKLMRKDPDLTISEARQAWPFTPAFMSHLSDGLEIAGLPRA